MANNEQARHSALVSFVNDIMTDYPVAIGLFAMPSALACYPNAIARDPALAAASGASDDEIDARPPVLPEVGSLSQKVTAVLRNIGLAYFAAVGMLFSEMRTQVPEII